MGWSSGVDTSGGGGVAASVSTTAVLISHEHDEPDQFVIPGPPGTPGDAGAPGATGATGVGVMGPPGQDSAGDEFIPDVRPVKSKKISTWNYMSRPQPVVGTGRSFYAPQDCYVVRVYAYCDTAPISTLTVSYLINGVNAWPSGTKPTITAGNYLGADAYPDTKRIKKGDKITPRIDNRGGVTSDRICFAIVVEEDLL